MPQAWDFSWKEGASAFVHPDGVYDDPKGGILREALYPRLRRHYQFTNEYKLFEGIDHHTGFSLNVYSNKETKSFDSIGNLFIVNTLDQCYDLSIKGEVPGIKDENGNWSIQGHPDRVISVGEKELRLFAKLFDGSEQWKQARLPVLHAKQFVEVLARFASQKKTLGDISSYGLFTTVMMEETGSQTAGIIERDVHFPVNMMDVIYYGPHIGVANPLYKTSRRVCVVNSDYDSVDLTNINTEYLQRCNYRPNTEKYTVSIPSTPSGEKYTAYYRLVMRKMLNQSGERTLIASIIPPGAGHIDGVFGMTFSDYLPLYAGCFASIPWDFFIKAVGKANCRFDTVSSFPSLENAKQKQEIILRALLLNCLNKYYISLWKTWFQNDFTKAKWSKKDARLDDNIFMNLSENWTWNTPLRTDYERRQALVEIDVLTAMALEMTLSQLKTLYRIQFPVLQSYEGDTWYDVKGRIVFTNNRGLVGIGFSRPEWENQGAIQPAQRGTKPWDGIMKNAPAGYVFARTITDDTMPVGPIERTIKYVAPFDRCNREQDYETAWKFFEEKYGKGAQ